MMYSTLLAAAAALSLALWLVGAVPVHAQTATTSPDRETAAAPARIEQHYLVEVIVFNYHGSITADGEIWHRSPPVDFAPSSLFLGDGGERDSEPANENAVEYTTLQALMPYLRKLYRAPQYEVVTYTAWTQTLSGRKESPEVQLVPPPATVVSADVKPHARLGLEGTVRLYENRLLFLELEIENPINGDIAGASSTAAVESGIFRLREKRRVKLNELHYFDHPYFGLLARVSRWEPGASSAEPD